jgi:Ion channel
VQDHGRHRRLTAMRERVRDWSLYALLLVQIVIIFGVGPLLAFGVPISSTVAGSILLAVIFFVLVAAPSRGPMAAIITALLFNAVSATILRGPGATVALYWVNAIGTLLSISGLSWVVVQMVFSPGPIDRHRIVGAVVLYLNLALAFDALFRLVAGISPGAFTGLAPGLNMAELSGDLLYFSMTTLTTVGYGDIAPVHPVARSLANMEGLFGQLYPAIILARIMTLYRSRV